MGSSSPARRVEGLWAVLFIKRPIRAPPEAAAAAAISCQLTCQSECFPGCRDAPRGCPDDREPETDGSEITPELICIFRRIIVCIDLVPPSTGSLLMQTGFIHLSATSDYFNVLFICLCRFVLGFFFPLLTGRRGYSGSICCRDDVCISLSLSLRLSL